MHPRTSATHGPLLSRRYEKTHATYCPFRPKNLKTYCCNMFGWFGEVGGTRKNHTHRCVSSFYYLAERKVRKTTKIIFRVFNTCNSSPILLFCPRNPKGALRNNRNVAACAAAGNRVRTILETPKPPEFHLK